MSTETSIPFLTRELRVFLRHLDRTRRQIEQYLSGTPGATDLPNDPLVIRERLAALLDKQVDAAHRENVDTKAERFHLAQWVMARLADVTLDSFAWWGRRATRPLTDDFPLPDGMPVDVVKQVDEILDTDPPDSELAELYLLVLAAGLEPATDARRREELAAARRELLTRVVIHRPELMAGPPSVVFPDAYRRNQTRGKPGFLPPLRPWVVALVLVMIGMFAASALVYQWATRSVTRTLDTILHEPR
ncbi:MAG TPA: DotU family type IV/VI secretion system protein [Thermoanaerobaculia bacterium]|nr:DotU family type IV/VI secretion system protein [Thermoanaerobaculia bacterium]